MKSTAKQNWFDDLINDFVPNVPECSQFQKQDWEQNKNAETLMNKGYCDSVPNVPNIPKQKGKAEKIIPITRNQETIIRNWLTEIGEPEADHFLVLSKCKHDPEALIYYLGLAAEHARAKRREKVLRMLSENPDTKRAIITDLDSDSDNVILTIAIRDVATSEMLIPKYKYDGLVLLELIHNLDHATESNH